MTFEEWFNAGHPMFDRPGRDTSLKEAMRRAWNAALVSSEKQPHSSMEAERLLHVTRGNFEAECADVDKVLSLFPDLQRTEGGRLPVAKMVNAICDLSARCKAAETVASETKEIPEEASAKVIDELLCTFPYPHLTEHDARRLYAAVRRGLK